MKLNKDMAIAVGSIAMVALIIWWVLRSQQLDAQTRTVVTSLSPNDVPVINAGDMSNPGTTIPDGQGGSQQVGGGGAGRGTTGSIGSTPTRAEIIASAPRERPSWYGHGDFIPDDDQFVDDPLLHVSAAGYGSPPRTAGVSSPSTRTPYQAMPGGVTHPANGWYTLWANSQPRGMVQTSS